MQRSGYLDEGSDGEDGTVETMVIQYHSEADDGNYDDDDEVDTMQPGYIITEEEEDQNDAFHGIEDTNASAKRAKRGRGGDEAGMGKVESDEDAQYEEYEEGNTAELDDPEYANPNLDEQGMGGDAGGGGGGGESDADFIAYSDEEDEENSEDEDASDREAEEIRTAHLPLPPLPPPVPPVQIHNMETEEVYNIIRELRRQVDHEASREDIRQLLHSDTSVLLAVAQVLHESKLMRRIGVNAHGVREEQILPLPDAAAPTLPAGYTSWVNAAQMMADSGNRTGNPRASARLSALNDPANENGKMTNSEKRVRESNAASALLPAPPAHPTSLSNVEVVVGNHNAPGVAGHVPPPGGAYPARRSRRGGQRRRRQW